MNRIARFGLLVSLLALSAFSAAAQNAPVVAEKNGITVSVAVKGSSAEITVRAEAKGWVAVGFDPTNKMKDARMFIGYVKDGVAYAREDFGTGAISHAPAEKAGGRNTIESFSGTEKDGMTTMTFVVPVDPGYPKGAKLTSGEHTVIVARSNTDSFTGMHSKTGKTKITLP